MSDATCSVEGCGRQARARGLCAADYQRLRRNGLLPPLNLTFEDRFNAKVDRSGGPDACWPWTGYMGSSGYGAVYVDQHEVKAHRVAYLLAFNDPGEMYVCHHCDVRLCCNPAHLFLGTHADNMADMRAKGRGPKGSRIPTAVLTPPDVLEIRAGFYRGDSDRSLAERFGVSPGTIWAIRTGKTWKHI